MIKLVSTSTKGFEAGLGLGQVPQERHGSDFFLLYIMAEFCEVGYLATLARAEGHNFKGWGKVLGVGGCERTIKWQTEKKARSHSITNVFLTAFHSIPSSDSASEAPLYLKSEHKATDPTTSLC